MWTSKTGTGKMRTGKTQQNISRFTSPRFTCPFHSSLVQSSSRNTVCLFSKGKFWRDMPASHSAKSAEIWPDIVLLQNHVCEF